MNNNPEGAKLAKETLTGDIAAFLIDRLRQFPKPYQQMSEKEQKEQIEMAKEAARNLVSNAVNIVASAGRKTVKAKLIKYSVKDGCKADPDQREMFDNCNTEYQDADGEGIPDPEQSENEVPALPAPEDQNITDAEFEEVDSADAENSVENEENSDIEVDSVDDEFAQAEQEFVEDETQPAA